MSVGILIITHPGIGNALLTSARRILPDCTLQSMCLEVPLDVATEKTTSQALAMVERLNQGSGVLILTDIFGATPHNIASKLAEDPQVRVISGLNLPMLVRLFNYPDNPLREMCGIATEGARRGIGSCGDS